MMTNSALLFMSTQHLLFLLHKYLLFLSYHLLAFEYDNYREILILKVATTSVRLLEIAILHDSKSYPVYVLAAKSGDK